MACRDLSLPSGAHRTSRRVASHAKGGPGGWFGPGAHVELGRPRYQGVYFSQINPIARAFAAGFLVQAALFVIHAALARGLELGPRSRLRSLAGAVMVAYAMIAYPIIGLAVGESYLAMPLFGVTPCPLLIFTFGLMLWAACAQWWLWISPIVVLDRRQRDRPPFGSAGLGHCPSRLCCPC